MNIICSFFVLLSAYGSIVHNMVLNSPTIFYADKEPFFHLMIFNDKTESVYLGGVDYVYKLSGRNITFNSIKSENLSTITNYASMYINSVNKCQSLNLGNLCRNHMRLVQPINNNQLFVCSTGSNKQQEYYLNESSLSVIKLSDNGVTKCPSDLISENIFVYSNTGLYTGLFQQDYGYQIYHTPPALTLPTQKNNLVVSGVNYIASFEIDDFIYFFFREMSFDSPLLGSIQHTKVARVCKNDEGGLVYYNQFMTYVKARIVCSLTKSGSAPIIFNNLVDMQYDSNMKVFYGLFLNNGDSKWGFALCMYNYSSIFKVFNESAYMDASSKIAPNSLVPIPRISSCFYTTTKLNSDQELFASTNYIMVDPVNPIFPVPPFSSPDILIARFTYLNFNSTHVVFFFTLKDDRHVLKRMIYNVADHQLSQLTDINLNSDVSLDPLVDIKIKSFNKINYIFLLYENALVQMPLDICSNYNLCTDCIGDIWCGWDTNTNKCNTYTNGNLYFSENLLNTCSPYCKVPNPSLVIIPGMAIVLPFISRCSTTKRVTWIFNNTLIYEDSKYAINSNNSLIILSYAANNAGLYQCVLEKNILVEYNVTTSACSYGEDLRTVMLAEFKNWCTALDQYRQTAC